MRNDQEVHDVKGINKLKERFLHQKSIKEKLQINISVLAIIIALLCGTVSSFILYRVANRNMQTRISESTAAYSQSVHNAIQTYKAEIEAVAQNIDITDSNKTLEQKNQVLKNLAEKYGYDKVMVADSEGNTLEDITVAEREYFSQAMAGNTYLSSTLVSKIEGTVMLILSAKATSNDYNGVVYGTLDSNVFSEIVDDIAIGESGYGFITDKDGKIIAHKNQEIVNQEVNYIEMAKEDSSYAGLADMTEHMTAGKTGIEKETFQGTKLTIGYTSIPNTDGWSIGVAVKTSELMKDFYYSVISTVVLAALLVIGSLYMAAKISNPIVNPIISMIQRIELLNKGDLHTKVPEFKTEDEIGTLSRSLIDTIDSLNAIIGETSSVLTSLQQGDCTVTSELEYEGDFIPLKTALNGIISNLNKIFSSFRISTDQVAAGADQVSSAAQSLAYGATEQAATIEELNASIENVAQQAGENVETVNQSNEYVVQAEEELSRSSGHMNSLNDAMSEISEAFQKISGITKVIEDIAFQTNLLALNAAIEAARAGDAGKGFAVVADEVRDLAAKVAEASKQVTVLVQHSSEVVEDGSNLSVETMESLKKVEERTNTVAQSMQRVKESSVGQAGAIEQINSGLAQISAVVQTNAATSEESSASSEELAAQAQAMKEEISWIKLID